MTALIQTLAVAEYLSFHIPRLRQSRLSTAVDTLCPRNLEKDLGIILFDRNTRGVRLTEAGRRFVDQVEDAIGILDRAIQTAGMQGRGEDGELRIGLHALTPGCCLDRLLERFHADHPGVGLHITEGTARDAQLMVRESRLDLAFMARTHEIPDLNSRVIWRDRLMVALPAGHALTAMQDVEWRQLAGETFLVRHGGTGPQVHDHIVLRLAGRWPAPSILRFDVGRGTLLSMVGQGFGVTIVGAATALLPTTGIVFPPFADEPEPVAFTAVWLPANRNMALQNLLSLAGKMNHHADSPSQLRDGIEAAANTNATHPIYRR